MDAKYRRKRKESFCGAKPGGSAAYYYQERCILKTKHTALMRVNRRAASFVRRARAETAAIAAWFSDRSESDVDELPYSTTTEASVTKAYEYMIDTENMAKLDMLPRLEHAVSKKAHKSLQTSDHFRALVLQRVAAYFASSTAAIEGFHRK